MSLYEDLSVGKLTVTGGGAVGAVAAVSGLTAQHKQVGMLYQSKFTLSSVAQSVVNGTEYQSTKLYDFPEGRILVLGVTASIAEKTTSDVATTLNASVTGAIGLGTAAASATTLSAAMVDLLPSTAFTTSATTNVSGAAVSASLAASAQFDGTATAKSMYINTAYATTLDVDANATQVLSGQITVTWIFLGDL